MGLFDIFKKGSSVVWRDKNGVIRCPGDSCSQKCDNTCPIWCQTMGISMIKIGQNEKAIEELKKAISIAPDFKDAWVNLAAIYGSMNNHMEAYRAYKVAYSIDNKYKNAIFGLIISCKNLGQFEEALKYCDEYANKVDRIEADKLKKQIYEVQKKGKIIRQESAIMMATKIIDHARKDGLLGYNSHMPQIPEIISQSKRTCGIIIDNLTKVEDKNGLNPIIWLGWGAFAGIGAVYLWHVNWDELRKKGIPESLLEPRGVFSMDEYVLDTIGIPFESPQGKEFGVQIMNLSKWTYDKFVNIGTSQETMVNIALEAMQSMYIFGMVYEMERIGLK